MNVICKYKCGRYPPLVIPIHSSSSITLNEYVSNREGYTIEKDISGYCISENAQYEVYGVLIFSEQIRYLIQDDNGIPGFFPHILFEIGENHSFYEWEVLHYSTENGEMLWMGYPDIVDNYEGIRDLVDERKEAIARFLKSKEHIQETMV